MATTDPSRRGRATGGGRYAPAIVFRRGRRRLPDDWQRIAAAHLTDWPYLAPEEQEWMRQAIAELLATRRWEAARGFELTTEMCTVIAAQIALVCLGFDDEGLDAVDALETVIVHPRTITIHGTHHEGDGMVSEGPRRMTGEAHDGRGPLLLSWDSVRRETRFRRGRRNVVVHEVAHKLDMLDGVIDGTPPLDDPYELERWRATSTAVYRAVRYRGDELIDDYAGTNPAEFFAVVSEVFFTRPGDLQLSHPDLYDCFRSFYRQDPAARRGLTPQPSEA